MLLKPLITSALLAMPKRYTPIRQFYAWVGFLTLVLVYLALLILPWTYNTTTYVREVKNELLPAVVTAYSSEIAQTDDTPFTTASNEEVRKGIVANNCLDFGTKVLIEGQEYEVQDRMNSRYGCHHFDIWFPKKETAVEWGRQHHIIEVIQQ